MRIWKKSFSLLVGSQKSKVSHFPDQVWKKISLSMNGSAKRLSPDKKGVSFLFPCIQMLPLCETVLFSLSLIRGAFQYHTFVSGFSFAV